MPKPNFSLTPDGYFTDGKQRIVPVGVNYWPPSCGVEMWREWPVAELQRDLDTMRRLGFNCVRFFLRWQDFEPEPGRYNRAAFQRLGDLLDWCRDRGILAHPSLFVGWMSGGIFWPEWKGRRNLFTDAFMRRRAFAFAARAARAMVRHRDIVLAIDQGNEICCLPDCLEAPPGEVASWCAEVNAAVRRSFPGAILVSGCEHSQITADTGWRLGAQPGCDVYTVHVYPNSVWHSLRFDGMTDPLAKSLFPFYYKCARAFGPVMAQELGTIFAAGECADDYLRGALPGGWDAGANGYLWWSLGDFTSRGHPYNKNAFECVLGVATEQGELKPTVRYFGEFAATLAARPAPVIDQGDIAIYWPRHYYHRDNPLNPGNEPRLLSRRLIIAHFALGELGHRVGVVRGDLPLDGISAHTIVVTGAALIADEVAALVRWVRAGGKLIWHGVDAPTYGPDANELIGAVAIDLIAPRAEGVKVFGATWDFQEFPRDVRVGVDPRQARVAAADRAGRPLVLLNHLGRGTVATCLAQPDEHFAARSDDRADRPRWLRWYRGMLELANQPAAKGSRRPVSRPRLKAAGR